MDAKITKQRLGNLLAYDWLKILAAIVAAAVVLSLLFTMVGTRPTEAQTFEVYAYTDVGTGDDFYGLSDNLKKKAFSYDILKVTTENFSDDGYASTVFTARRAAGEGSVMFISDVDEFDEEGKLTRRSSLYTMSENAVLTESRHGGYYDTEYFMALSRAYLQRFFGEDLSGPLNEEEAEEEFLSRNAGDKRFRSAENKLLGIGQEKERLQGLREDYLVVEGALASGKLAHRKVTYGEGDAAVTYSPAFDVTALDQITKLFYRAGGEAPTAEGLCVMLIYNDYGKGASLAYDTLSFLSYLVETYAE